MRTIEIDDSVFEELQKRGEAFVDTPNSVLRRLFGLDHNQQHTKRMTATTTTQGTASTTEASRPRSDKFVGEIWTRVFETQPEQVGRYRMMFEDRENIVYFQNFNKPDSPNLWYRLNPSPLKTLSESDKISWICLTNPSEKTAYLIPLDEIYRQVATHKWTRPAIEVNIDAGEDRWREFDWILSSYRVGK